MTTNVCKGEKIQIAGTILSNGQKLDGFLANVKSSSTYNHMEGLWEVWFKSDFPKIEGTAIFNEELNMWDLIEEECTFEI